MPRAAAACPVFEMPSPAVEELRYSALQRLYVRRDVVDALIRSLESYEEGAPRPAVCIEISARARKCS